jgi:hypothetical protein
LAVSGTTAAALYVDARCSGGDGKSWRTAYQKIEDALQQAKSGDEIWVAAGSYKLTDRGATFQLKTGVGLYGGFKGNEPDRLQRDWQQNPTILDGNGAYHVVTGADQAVLDGFTITGGNGLGGELGGPPAGGRDGRPIHITPQRILSGGNLGSGAGMVNFQVAPTVRNCIFENNTAGKGGAVYNMTSTDFPPRPDGNAKTPVFINCVFRNNFARGRGGGVSNDLGTAPVFLNCIFETNETPQKGGGMYNDFGCSPTLINCLFTGNRAQTAAGMGNDGGSSPVLYFCTFTKNHANEAGPSLYQGTGPANNPSLINCLLTGNTCDWESPGIYNWHDNTPFIEEPATGDAGYKPERFSEAQFLTLLSDLRRYHVRPARAPFEATPEKIPSSERVVYADVGHTDAGDGRAWATAYASLQAAINDAGKDGAEVRVAAGTYQLGTDRSASFVLRPGVRVYGGYRDNTRDVTKHPSVLNGNHAYHVVTGANGALLDGFMITGGYADGPGYDGKGGGLINYRRAPQGRPNSPVVTGFTMTIRHCTFTNNYARDGGAVYSYDRAKPVFVACIFAANRSENGGAVLDRVGVESTFQDCEFTGNTARWRGGALYFDYGSRPKLTGCVFHGNTTDGHGGAVFSVSRASQLENTVLMFTACRFEGNTAKGFGGAANFHDSSVATVQNCTFTGNQAGTKGNAIAVTSNSSLQSKNNTVADRDIYEEPSTGPRGSDAVGQPPEGFDRGQFGGGRGGHRFWFATVQSEALRSERGDPIYILRHDMIHFQQSVVCSESL